MHKKLSWMLAAGALVAPWTVLAQESGQGRLGLVSGTSSLYHDQSYPSHPAGYTRYAQDEPTPANPLPDLAPPAQEVAPSPSSVYDPQPAADYPGQSEWMDPAALDPTATSGCGVDGTCDDGCSYPDVCCSPRWYAGLGAIYMTRDNPNAVWTSYDLNNPTSAVMSSRDADPDWRWGFEIRAGRRFCNNWGLEASYWYLDPLEGDRTITCVGDTAATPINLTGVTLGGLPVSTFFDNALQHRVYRRDEFQNLEVNFINGPLLTPCSGRFGLSWLAGVRFFRFDERFLFAGTAAGFEFGQDPTQEAYYAVDVTNNLIGFQLGGRADWYLGNRVRAFAIPKVGIYANHIQHVSELYRGDGVRGFNISSNTNDVSMLAELNLGVDVRITERLSAYGGYRAIGVSGVALSDNQIPPFLADSAGIAAIDSNGSLIVHGAMFGLNYAF